MLEQTRKRAQEDNAYVKTLSSTVVSTTMEAKSPLLSNEEFKQFHRIDRCLYNITVLKLNRDPIESIQIHALFLWLESKGCVNLVHKLLHCPLQLLEIILDEAALCLSCIDPNPTRTTTPKLSDDIPVMNGFLNGKLSGGLHFFHENQLKVYEEISSIIDRVCLRALSDIASRAIQVQHHRTHRNPTVPGQQQPQPMRAPRWPDGRTLFMTFSKGYPLSEWEVQEFLTTTFGNCVESIHMQQVVPPNEQSLHAHIVLCSTSALDLILGPDPHACLQFTIHGKDARVRRFDTDQPKSLMRQSH